MASNSWWRRLFQRDASEPDLATADLVEVASSFDDAEACSAALARAVDWQPEQPVVLRHLLRLPAGRVEEVRAIAAQDGYSIQDGDLDADPVEVALQRVQLLDALHCSQERSRMAGLAQRHDGEVLGWLALQPRRS
ncbi:hypothetical protein [Nocardia sp. NPDC050406]|uniref:hypothetical protein n=1 Tax=Nocardia sp. NPDC050406 TaxID=3364318 RepID=UPI0037A1C24D